MEQAERDVREALTSIIRQLAPDPGDYDGTGDVHLVDQLGFHSLALLELAFAIEDDFDLPPIDEETGRTIATSEQVIAYVLGQLAEQGDPVTAAGAPAPLAEQEAGRTGPQAGSTDSPIPGQEVYS